MGASTNSRALAVAERSTGRGGAGQKPRRGQQQQAFRRQWALVQYLHKAKVGRTIAQMGKHLQVGRATVYRYLDFLTEVGIAISKSVVTGEARYVLLGDPLPGMRSAVGRHALILACEALKPFQGTQMFRELQKLRDERPAEASSAQVAVKPEPAASSAQVLSLVERALSESRQLSLRYRGASDAAARTREVAPLELRLAKGQVYLLANEIDTDAQRTFKIARIESATIGERFDRAARHPAPMDHAVVTWSGDVVEVAIRISPEGARFVTEFPLIKDQRVETAEDGSVVVRAQVAGIHEALKWTLSWGRKAEALAPAELRARAKQELREALERYDAQGVSDKVRQGRAKVAAGEKQKPAAVSVDWQRQ